MPRRSPSSRAAGFTLVELLISMTVLMIGIVAVAQLMPIAMRTNFQNRYDSTALIAAQRQLEEMTTVPELRSGSPAAANSPYFFNQIYLPSTTVSGYLATPSSTHRVDLGVSPNCFPFTEAVCGTAWLPGPSTYGAPLAQLPDGAWIINWNAARSLGYWHQHTTPEGYSYETRWHVWTFFGSFNGVIRPVAKRFFVSTRGGAAGVTFPPVQLTTMVGWRRD